jgi:hypothetical protein
MPTSTYDLIASATVTSAVSSIDVTSIPQTNTHLYIIISPNINAAARPNITVNNLTTNIYRFTTMNATSSGSITSTNLTTNSIFGLDDIADTNQSAFILTISDYNSGSKNKPFNFRTQAGNNEDLSIVSGEIGTTSAITSIKLTPSSGLFTDGTKVSIWGMLV